MKELVVDPNMIARCGLYCGACKRYRKGKCPGCTENEKAAWCKVRACCLENDYKSCADCKIVGDVMECKKFNNFMARIFAVFFRSDRPACITMIRDKGYDEFAAHMTENGLQSLKR